MTKQGGPAFNVRARKCPRPTGWRPTAEDATGCPPGLGGAVHSREVGPLPDGSGSGSHAAWDPAGYCSAAGAFASRSRACALSRIAALIACRRSGQAKVGAFAGSYPSRWPVSRVAGLVYFTCVSAKTSRQIAESPASYSSSSARVFTWLWSWTFSRLLSNHDCTPSAKYSAWLTLAYFPFQSPAFIAAS